MKHRRNPAGALFFGALTVFAAGCAALAAYETYSLAVNDAEPITQRTRYVVAKNPGPTHVIILALGVLIGHLIWGPADNGKEWWE